MTETAQALTKSASALARQLGLDAQELNFLFKLAGIYDGEPGAWRLTEKGARFATELSHTNGYGGYAHRAWDTIKWDPKVLRELDLSDAVKQQARQLVADRRLAKSAALKAARAAADAEFLRTQAAKHAADAAPAAGAVSRTTVTVGLGVAVAAGYGLYKAVPLIRRRRQQRADAQQARDRTDCGAPPENLA